MATLDGVYLRGDKTQMEVFVEVSKRLNMSVDEAFDVYVRGIQASMEIAFTLTAISVLIVVTWCVGMTVYLHWKKKWSWDDAIIAGVLSTLGVAFVLMVIDTFAYGYLLSLREPEFMAIRDLLGGFGRC